MELSSAYDEPADQPATSAYDGDPDAPNPWEGWAARDDFGDSDDDEARPSLAAEPAADASEPEPVQGVESPAPASQYSSSDYLAGIAQLDKELDALADRYESGEIEFREYRQLERQIEGHRQVFHHQAASLAAHEQARDQAWREAANEFTSDPGNKAFVGVLRPAFESALGAALQGVRPNKQAYSKVLATTARKVRAELTGALGGAGGVGKRRDDTSGWAARD